MAIAISLRYSWSGIVKVQNMHFFSTLKKYHQIDFQSSYTSLHPYWQHVWCSKQVIARLSDTFPFQTGIQQWLPLGLLISWWPLSLRVFLSGHWCAFCSELLDFLYSLPLALDGWSYYSYLSLHLSKIQIPSPVVKDFPYLRLSFT